MLPELGGTHGSPRVDLPRVSGLSHDIFLNCQCVGMHSQALVRLTYATVIDLKNRQKADL